MNNTYGSVSLDDKVKTKDGLERRFEVLLTTLKIKNYQNTENKNQLKLINENNQGMSIT